jgi:hypothetical protein
MRDPYPLERRTVATIVATEAISANVDVDEPTLSMPAAGTRRCARLCAIKEIARCRS